MDNGQLQLYIYIYICVVYLSVVVLMSPDELCLVLYFNWKRGLCLYLNGSDDGGGVGGQ